MTAPSQNTPGPSRQVRSRTHPGRKPEPDLNRLFNLDRLDEIDREGDLSTYSYEVHLIEATGLDLDDEPAAAPVPSSAELWRRTCNERGAWMERWRVSAKGWPYINTRDFNVVVYRSGAGWAYRIAERTPPGAPLLVYAQDAGYTNETAAKLSAIISLEAMIEVRRELGDRP